MTGFLQDLRYALRQLGKSHGFAAVAILTVALGIGANTMIFSAVDAVLLQRLPFRHADRLITLWGVNPSRGWTDNPVSPRWFVEWQKQNDVFADMALFQPMISFNLSGTGVPEEVAGERATPNLFSVLGVTPVLGRSFVSEDSETDSRVAVLSYGLWQRKFSGSLQILGEPILLNGEPYSIVGILPANFSHSYTASFLPFPQVWVAGLNPNAITDDDKSYGAIARLKPGVTLQQAQMKMDTIARRIEQQYPEDKGWRTALYKAQEKSVEYTRPALLVLWVAVLLVMLIACANLANLLLARGEARNREFAVRAALGASEGRLFRQLLTESLLLSILGTVVGFALAQWGSKALVAMIPSFLLQAAPGLQNAGINGRVLVYCILAAIVTGLLFGLAPAIGDSRVDVNESLKESGKSSTHGRQSHKFREFLVISEFALALVLLVGAGLMIRTLMTLSKLDLGFNRSSVLTMKLPLLGLHLQNTPQRIEFLRQLLPLLAALPGVQSATLTRGLPIEGWSGWYFITEDNPTPPPGQVPDANYNIVGPEYFRTLGVPLLKGRPVTEADTPTSLPVAIVSEQLARQSWRGQNPLGKRIKINPEDKTQPWRSVVGVAGNVMAQGPDSGIHPELYIPYTQAPWLVRVSLAIRTASDPAAVTASVRKEINSLDRDVPVSDVKTLAEIASEPVAQRRVVMILLLGFASLALILAAAGVYSVISYAVTLRTREIGLRIAFGAQRGQVLNMILKRGAWLGLTGSAIGIACAFALSRFLASQLFGVPPTDFTTFALVTFVLMIVMLFASYMPARRATKVDPIAALHYE